MTKTTEARPIARLLVANRGEIARRVMRTARAMGIATVAVYAEPDARQPFVQDADVAAPLAGSAAAETYLDIEQVMDAAARAGADAIHPGYGFLSENAAFARACADAGVIFVGPDAGVIAAMGSKLEAKELMRRSGVPVLPAVAIGELDGHRLRASGEEVGYPLLVKASAGGGGRGMHLVRDADAVADAVATAQREAARAFGDGTVFLEPFLEGARHIEVQVFGDRQGNIRHLFERECSIQRRHQKLIEESPAPGISSALRERLWQAAVTAARAVGYTSAGTVEFIVAGEKFYFLEMNTRLQVEHPVTEMITGLDLVRLQLMVAQGEPLPFEQHQVVSRGHAIEARLYAEAPASGFTPTAGVVHRYQPPETEGIRADDGIADGSVVDTRFDAMLSKVISHAPGREEAVARLASALARTKLHGVRTNVDFLVRVLRHPAFRAGDIDTGFIERYPELFLPLLDSGQRRVYAVAAALAAERERRRDSPVLRTLPSGWRNVRSGPQRTDLDADGERVSVSYAFGRDRCEVQVDGEPHDLRVVEAAPDRVSVELDGMRYTLDVNRVGVAWFVNGPEGQLELREVPRFREVDELEAAGSCLAPLPGTVVAVRVAAGDEVRKGQGIVVIEAMKMELSIEAPHDGRIAQVLVSPGDSVDAGQVLVVLEQDEDSGEG